jgi:transcriptional regulator with GAF, ATPase, and Fis domain
MEAEMEMKAQKASPLAQAQQRIRELEAELEGARAAEHEQRVLAEALREITGMISGGFSLDDVFEQILAHVAHVVPYDAASILLIEEDAFHKNLPCVKVSYVRGHDRSILGLRFPLDGPNFLQIMTTGRPFVINDTRTYDGWVAVPETNWIRSSLAAAIAAAKGIAAYRQGKSSVRSLQSYHKDIT